MGKEGLNNLLDFRDAKVNIFTLLAVVLILALGAYFAEGLGTITIVSSPTIIDRNISDINSSTGIVQLFVLANLSSANYSNLQIANITINITVEGNGSPVFLNNTVSPLALYNNSNNTNLSGVVLSFNISGLPEGVFTVVANSTLNETLGTESGKIGNSTNITIRVDKSSPIINATNSNNLTYQTIANGNQTGNTINITLTAHDLITTIKNITLHRNGTVVNFSNAISQNATTTINYVLRGIDINEVYNFTINVTDHVGRSNQTDGVLVAVTSDGTAPGPILINASLQDEFNQTSSTAPTFEFTAFDNNDTQFNCNITIAHVNDSSPFYANITNLNVTNGTAHVNTTSIGLSNGTYNWNVSCWDGSLNHRMNTNTSLSQKFTVDNIAPLIRVLNITNGSIEKNENGSVGSEALGNVPNEGAGTWAQGRKILTIANVSDNLTTVSEVLLQFFNESSGSWQTINTTQDNERSNITTGFSTKTPKGVIGFANLSFLVPSGHNEFEGTNVTFRVLVNDTLGNVNSSGSVRNITIQINDTTAPTIAINGTFTVNGSNITDTTPTIGFSLVEYNALTFINISIDANQTNQGKDSVCEKSAVFDTSSDVVTVNVERNRNASITVKDECVLNNGAHNVTVTALDANGNRQIYHFTFNLQSGTQPGFGFNLTGVNGISTWNKTAANKTNITSLIGVNLFGMVPGPALPDKIVYTSSCDSTQVTVTNNTVVYPFNSSCATASGNRTLTVTVNDTAGNSNTTVLGFLVDNIAPSMAVNYPTNGQTFTLQTIQNDTSLNLSVKDDQMSLAFVGYYLDDQLQPFKINQSAFGSLGGAGANTTFSKMVSFNQSGTRIIKFTANDSLGNAVNSSSITITIAAIVDARAANSSIMVSSGGNVSNLLFLEANGSNTTTGSLQVNQTLKLTLELNETAERGANLTIQFNGSAANWNKTNFVRVIVNDSNIAKWVRDNQSATVVQSIFVNRSISEFLGDNNSYFGKVTFGKLNLTLLGGQGKLLYFADELNMGVKTNITQCSANFAPTATQTLSEGTFPCWNQSENNKTVDIFVPHFSVVVFANDSSAPTVNVTIPQNFSNVSVAMFVPNITVSPDAVSCKFIVNGSTANETMVKSGNVCLGSTQRFKNVGTGPSYNINFTVEDSSGNINNYVVNFNVTDNTKPNTPNATRVSVSSGTTTATITITANESVNASVQSNGTSSFTTGVQTDYNQTQAISLSSLSASTTYTFNVTICDFAGNCAENATGLSFTTSAADSTSSSTTSSSSSSGGGGGTTTASAVADSKAQLWSSIPAGSSVSLNVDKGTIAVTSISVNNAQSNLINVELEAASLDKNPVSEEASSKVYQYLRLTKKNLKDTDAESFKVGFRVTKEWLTANSLASGDVALYRYNNGWAELATSVVSSDETYVNYEANTPGFSSFAIGAKSIIAPTEEKKEEVAPSEEKPKEEAKEPEKVERPEPVKSPGKAPTAWIIAAIVVILGIVMIVAYQKNKKKF